MNLHLNEKLGDGYKSNSQKARVITETWTESNLFCPVCGSPHLMHCKVSSPVADFYCEHCHSEFEQKSQKRNSVSLPKTLEGGAYSAMEARLKSDENPHLLVLTYADGKVNNLVMVPKHFFSMSVVEKRKPLKPTAKRAGWVGSHILLKDIPESGKIYIVKEGVEEEPKEVLAKYLKTLPLKTASLTSRGWLLDMLKCVEKIPTKDFTLADVYAFIPDLETKHPGNRHINDKIRQQLQTLRDKGFISFVGRGKYRKIF